MGIGIKRSETGGGSATAGLLIDQAGSLFSDFNKAKGGQPGSGSVGDAEQLLSLDMDDKDLLALRDKWEEAYKKYAAPILKRQDDNEKYWVGKQYGFDAAEYRGVDNVVFEALETLLPNVSRGNPEPVVTGTDTAVADSISKVLVDLADTQSIKSKVKQLARHWALYYLACAKIGWNFVEDRLEISVVRPQSLVLDPTGTFDGGNFTGRYIGERKKEDAETVLTRFPGKEKEIREMTENKLGTEMAYTEWWTDKYVFWTIDGIVLDKRQNPHWNYETMRPTMDASGVPGQAPVQTLNHFKVPRKPYSFVWYFNLGKQPHDETSLLEQSKSLQDVVNKRTRQIDKNADDTNNGWVFNSQFDEDSAKQALNALRKGGAIIAPTASVSEAVTRFTAPPLPAYVIEDMYDKREQIRNLMGVRGSSAQGLTNEQTVRGKIEIKQADGDRYAPIVEQIEQCVDYLYNYAVQMAYVYYDDTNWTDALTQEEAMAVKAFVAEGTNRSVTVSVKPGSTIPQDPLTRRNEAVDLGTAGLLDPLTMFERMDFPNPAETAKRLIEFKIDPGALVGMPAAPVQGMPGTGSVPPIQPDQAAPVTATGTEAGLNPLPPI